MLLTHDILQEARNLHKVSDSLDALAKLHTPLEEALLTMSRNVRNSASLLEVVVALRLGPEPGFEGVSN
jgi:hypothetical protein